MEHKTWLWTRKSSEKANTLKAIKEEAEKAHELERSLKSLNEKLASTLTDSNAKDDLLAKQTKVAGEAISGWKTSEVEVASLKKELDAALEQNVAAEERIGNMEATLNDCMEQLHVVQEQRERLLNDVEALTKREKEKTQILEGKLSEMNERQVELVIENDNLNTVLEGKEKLIEDLREQISQLEENYKLVLSKLDSSEKHNTSLRYEVCMLEKELQIRNEERDFNLKSVDAAHKQHLESIKKITKLEAECNRLRVMVRKRLPGPAALAKMKSEVEILGRDVTEVQSKKSNLTRSGMMVKDGIDTSSKKGSLVERLHAVDVENKILKEEITKKNNELQSSQAMHTQVASRLSQVEKQLEELSKETSHEHTRSSPLTCDSSLPSISEDGGNGDNLTSTESWASALLSELENFRSGISVMPSSKTGVSDSSVTDSFVEMEKSAVDCVDKPPEKSKALSDSNCEIESGCTSFEKYPSWLKDILGVILQQHHVTHKHVDVILEEVRTAFSAMGFSVRSNSANSRQVGCDISQKSRDASTVSVGITNNTVLLSNDPTPQQFETNLETSVSKLIEVVNGINKKLLVDSDTEQISSGDYDKLDLQKKLLTINGYIFHVFQSKSSDLKEVLRHFINVCNSFLHGKIVIENFVSELTATLNWMIVNCFSLQDVSSLKEIIEKESKGASFSESEHEMGSNTAHPEAKEVFVSEECKYLIPSATSSILDIAPEIEDNKSKERNDNQRMEDRVLIEATVNESVITQVPESDERTSKSQMELTKLKGSKGPVQTLEKKNFENEDLDIQLSLSKIELNEFLQRFSSLKLALEDNTRNLSEESDATCVEPQTPQKSAMTKETLQYDMDQEENHCRTTWEISAASEKLAECQETILNIGKQLQALASSRNAMPTPVSSKTKSHIALRDQLLVDDDKLDEVVSPKTKEIISTGPQKPHTVGHSGVDGSDRHKVGTVAGLLAIVPKRQKSGVSLWRKLLLRRKKAGSKKLKMAIIS